MRNFPFRCRPKNWEQRRPYPFPTGCSFVWQRSDSACQWTSRDRTGLGWAIDNPQTYTLAMSHSPEGTILLNLPDERVILITSDLAGWTTLEP